MDWITGIQKAIDYTEAHLLEEIDYEAVAQQAYSSSFHFQRRFRFLCGFTLGDYIRMRRLSLAAEDLTRGREKIIDVALRYGYDTPESFSRAFARFHGVTPTEAKRGGQVRTFTPLSVKLILTGGSKMEYRIEKPGPVQVVCKRRQVTKPENARGIEDITEFWNECGKDGSMGRIVASPTAGSCGIMPGCLLTLMEEKGYSRRDIVMSMFTAAAFGIVIATNASIAGAQGGCQAECGSASGMTAAAMVELAGGTPAQCADACAIAIANQLGLVCDPVAGLVEIPCIKRNASGVVIAFSSADMALAGIKAYIPVDECIAAMNHVGNALPASLKETAKGGLAMTKTGLALKEKVFGKE